MGRQRSAQGRRLVAASALLLASSLLWVLSVVMNFVGSGGILTAGWFAWAAMATDIPGVLVLAWIYFVLARAETGPARTRRRGIAWAFVLWCVLTAYWRFLLPMGSGTNVEDLFQGLLGAYPAVLDGTAARTPQDGARATVFGRRRPEDGRVEWSWPAARIANMIRAVTHPYPGAFVGDGRLYLWAGSALSGSATAARPGTVLDVRPGEGASVATGDGAVLLRRVQEAGAGEEPGDVWALRRGFTPGTRLTEAS